METNLISCTRTGRTTSEKTMEDGNKTNIRDEKISSTSLVNLYGERPAKLTTNGHEFGGEASSPPTEHRRPHANDAHDDNNRKRINPLRIHLGKRPFVDNSLQYYNACKKKKQFVNRNSGSSVSNAPPRVPKLIPKRNQFHNVTSHNMDNSIVDNEQDKPVPRLVPKSQLMQFKKGKAEKGPHFKEYVQSLGLQPMVKFKCRKCCSMSFKTLAMLKEHQQVCRAQAKEPTLSPEAAPSATSDSNGGPSRVTRKVYLCSACGTYYENWNLFLHMREVHNRHICLFCLGMFSKAEKLSSHLTNKHNVQEFNYQSKEEFFNVYNGTLYLMCCACDEICCEQDDFFNHDCNNVKPKPVPLLVSKNASKPNSVKPVCANSIDVTANSSTSSTKTTPKCINEKKDVKEAKLETLTSQTIKTAVEHKQNDYNNTSIEMNNSINNKDTGIDSNVPECDKPVIPQSSNTETTPQWNSYTPETTKAMPNGDDNVDHSDESDSPLSDDANIFKNEALQSKTEETVAPPVEKECGIKLKLSLNNANSPVIINSTVDPTIGQQKAHKPPTRNRRPPKRYEKDTQPEPPFQPKTPSIKMTICDRADSPFVKTTIYENDKETTVKTILNNNMDSDIKSPEHKPENTIKTTIYDNKPENEENTLNRVPKLTVRVPKELLDKDSSSDYSSDSDVSDKLTVDENNVCIKENEEPEVIENTETEMKPEEISNAIEDVPEERPEEHLDVESVPPPSEDIEDNAEPKTETHEIDPVTEAAPEEPSIPVTELSLNRPLDKYALKDLLKVFLASTVNNCIYCNHVRKIAVNCEQLSLHMVAQHRFTATVDSITAEELMPETITAKLKAGAPELRSVYICLDSYDSEERCEEIMPFDHSFECYQCYFKTTVHKELYLHNRKMHQKTILLCVMCKSNFYSYSELLCHLCPGTYDSEYEIKFRCCFCNLDTIPSQFRLMVHLRKIHHSCDVCLEYCQNQARLSNHVWKHKLHHLCYRCGIAYRNKPDITNHLFWKHGTESVLCKRCMQKKWPHVYHFCTPPAIFLCDECNLQFSKAVYLKVHKRFHTQEFPHACTEEGCTEKFVSKKLLNKHMEEHIKKLASEDLNDNKPEATAPVAEKALAPEIPVIDLVDDKPADTPDIAEVKSEDPQPSKKSKKKKNKDKDALLLDVNLPALNLSESDSSDESDSGAPPPPKVEKEEEKEKEIKEEPLNSDDKEPISILKDAPVEPKVEEKTEPLEDEKPDEQKVLDIWDNFKKYQAKVEKQKSPPLVPIRKHVCESDHDYCLIPTDMNGDEDSYGTDKKKNKKSPKKHGAGGLSSSSSSSSDSDSSCSCGSNCSCSSSSRSSSSSSSDSDSSDDSGNEKKKVKRNKKSLPNRRISSGSNVDVMGMSETPILIPEKVEPPIAETDLETDESDTDEEFYDQNPQKLANKLQEEKRTQLPTAAPYEGGSVSGETSRPATPIQSEPVKEEEEKVETPIVENKPSSSKKKSKKKKKSKNSKKHAPIKINIPKEVIAKADVVDSVNTPPLLPNKITISLQSNTVQIPEAPKLAPSIPPTPTVSAPTPATSIENKRASKRRRVPNKFYGYSSDEETAPSTTLTALRPQQPPKLEWNKDDLPSPATQRTKKEIPSTILTNRLYNYTDSIRLTAPPLPDPEPPKILMNTESMDSSDSDSSEEGNLEIYQPSNQPAPIPPPTYLNSGTSSLPYPFQRPAVREAREGESVYCYCRCPYDEVSEMIACDAEGCPIEWFHFECVGIMVPPKGKWYCPECRKNQSFSGYR